MAHSVRNIGAASIAAWRRVLVHQGRALEAFGRELRASGSGQMPVEIQARDALGAVARTSADAAALGWQIGCEGACAALALWGVQVLAPSAPSTTDRDAA